MARPRQIDCFTSSERVIGKGIEIKRFAIDNPLISILRAVFRCNCHKNRVERGEGVVSPFGRGDNIVVDSY